MKILMVGAGGLGGYYGARLLAAKRDVTFLVRAKTAEQLSAKGLRVLSPHGDVSIGAPATVVAGDLRERFDLIVLTCKAQDLPGAMDALTPAVGEGTAILPLLNGMSHMDALDARFGRQHVLGGACLISATRDADGTIRHLGQPDRLFFGDRDEPESERMGRIAAELVGAGFEAKMRTDILQAMWEKWSFIATSAGITCLMRAAVGDLVAAGADRFAMQLFGENTSISAAEGFPPSDDLIRRATGMLTEAGSLFTASMLRDMEAGAPIEAQQIVGDLLAIGRRRGLETPLLEVVHANLRCYEERRRRETAGDAKG